MGLQMIKRRITKISQKVANSEAFQRLDKTLTSWMRFYGLTLLRISLGFVFLWFGALKFFPDLSPAEELVLETLQKSTFGLFTDHQVTYGLALWEVMIGLGLLLGRFMRAVLLLLFLQLPGTFLPIFLVPDQVFEIIPWVPTLKGQYIFKNLILVAAAIVLGANVGKKQVHGFKRSTNYPVPPLHPN